MMTLILFLIQLLISQPLQSDDRAFIEGRWDLEIEVDGKMLPSWLEVYHSGHDTQVGRFVYAFGSARPISEVKYGGGKYYFVIPRQWEPEGSDQYFVAWKSGENLAGTMVYTDGNTYQWSGKRAPLLESNNNIQWGEKVELFNGSSLNGWKADREANQWHVADGILTSAKSGANLISNKKFSDFKLIVEFRYPKESNSGIYLRGRYEVQIADNEGLYPTNILFGGIYGFLTPNKMAAKSAGEWQRYEITLIGREVSVNANGQDIIVNQIIPGITGGALDSNEGLPGPFMIQGDHGPIEIRKFEVIPALN